MENREIILLKDISKVIRWLSDLAYSKYKPGNYFKLSIESLECLKKSADNVIKFYKNKQVKENDVRIS